MNRPTHIKVILLQSEPAWELILGQIGIDWSVVNGMGSIIEENPSVIIVNRITTKTEENLLRAFCESNGALIFTTSEMHRVKNNSRRHIFITSLPPSVRLQYRFTDIFDLFQNVFLFGDDDLIGIERTGNGLISYLGIDVASVVQGSEIIRKDFYSKSQPFPNERVAKRSKNALLQLLRSHLEYLHHQRRLPFIHKWYYPKDHQSVFTFRIDSDKGTKEQIDVIYQLCERYKIPASWYLDVKSHEGWLEYFSRFRSQEIGVHCYEHSIQNSADTNMDNFLKAKSLLIQAGHKPKGITAPTGAWNAAVGKAIIDSGFDYSSEFGYDYDNLPSFPMIGGRRSPVLQLPIHPVCISSMLRSRMTSAEMTEYFTAIIDRNLRLNEPICLYHHPTHGHNEVFEEVFQYIDSKKILKMNYSEYSDWWKKRSQAAYSFSYDGERIVNEGISDPEVYVHISLSNGSETTVSFAQILVLSEMHFQHINRSVTIPADIMQIRKFSIRRIAQDILDWWITITE